MTRCTNAYVPYLYPFHMTWNGKRDQLGTSVTPCLGMVSLLAAVPKMSFQWVLRKLNAAIV